jgi:hypothetical protein
MVGVTLGGTNDALVERTSGDAASEGAAAAPGTMGIGKVDIDVDLDSSWATDEIS